MTIKDVISIIAKVILLLIYKLVFNFWIINEAHLFCFFMIFNLSFFTLKIIYLNIKFTFIESCYNKSDS